MKWSTLWQSTEAHVNSKLDKLPQILQPTMLQLLPGYVNKIKITCSNSDAEGLKFGSLHLIVHHKVLDKKKKKLKSAVGVLPLSM